MNSSVECGDCIVFDCDNTFGVPEHPVDDGLALLYLLGRQARLAGVTTTYGNDTVEITYENTKRMLRDIGRADIPVFKGGKSRESRGSEAAEFLTEQAKKHDGRLRILATGALTNLRAAYGLDPDFFNRVREIVLMGGITAPLFLNGVRLDELNFSSDPEATYCVLTNALDISIATGNNCLPAYIRHSDYETRLTDSARPIGRYIYEQTKSWFDVKVKTYDLDGFYAWDEVAAVCLLEKSLFEEHEYQYTATLAGLETGYIGNAGEPLTPPANSANLPALRDVRAFEEELYTNWLRL
jgi:purine nucleosidase